MSVLQEILGPLFYRLVKRLYLPLLAPYEVRSVYSHPKASLYMSKIVC